MLLRNAGTNAAGSIRTHSERDASRWPGFVKQMNRFASVLGALYQLVPPDIGWVGFGLAVVGVLMSSATRREQYERQRFRDETEDET